MDALDQLIQYGRKRGRELFPEGVPGLYPLSKSDINQDLDAMLVPMEPNFLSSAAAVGGGEDGSAKGRRRGGGGDVLPLQSTGETVKPSKRARLVEKVTREFKNLENLDAKERDLRNLLDVIRDEIKKYEVGIDQKLKEIAAMEKEREWKKGEYLDLQGQYEKKVMLLNEDAQKNQEILFNLKNSIIEITQRSTEALKDITELRVLKDQVGEFDARCRRLEIELQSCTQNLNAAEEALKSNNYLSLDSWEAFKKLSEEFKVIELANDDLKRSLSNAQLQTSDLRAELDASNNALDRLSEKKSTTTSPARSKVDDTAELKLKEDLDSHKKELTQLKNSLKVSQNDVLLQNDKNESLLNVLASSEKRAELAEKHLAEVSHRYSVVQSGFAEQQVKYQDLLEISQRLQEENEKFSSEADSLKKLNSKAQTSNTLLKSDVLKLQAGIQEMNTEVDGLNESLKTSTNRVRELEEQVKELSNALASAQAQLNLPDISELIPSTSTPSQPSSASKTRNRGAQSKKNTGD